MSKLYDASDLIKLFTKLEGKFEDLKCFVKDCCAKIPVNIGTGIGIFKRFNANKWEFKSLLPGNNILITETAKEIVISSTTEPIDCNDIKDCIGITPSGDANKYLNEQGDFLTITVPPAPTLQEVVNTGNGISNFGGIGTASIQSTNFTNNRTLYLNDNTYPTIRIVDNINASNYLQIDIDTLNLDGVSYNWSSIVNPTIPTVGTWGALNYPTWTTGTPFVKMTAVGTFSLDTNTYLTSAVLSVTGGTNISITGTATNPIVNKLNSERRNDWVAPYSYCGSAPNGSAESASVWTIYRIQVASDGTVTTLSATNVAWTDRLIVIYT
jgi:hypothetical protein